MRIKFFVLELCIIGATVWATLVLSRVESLMALKESIFQFVIPVIVLETLFVQLMTLVPEERCQSGAVSPWVKALDIAFWGTLLVVSIALLLIDMGEPFTILRKDIGLLLLVIIVGASRYLYYHKPAKAIKLSKSAKD